MKSGQPLVSQAEGEALGWTVVWQDPSWILWRIDAPPTP